MRRLFLGSGPGPARGGRRHRRVPVVPSPLQKWAVERGASVATGRQITFGEPFRLHAWPPVTITATDIRVANADWGDGGRTGAGRRTRCPRRSPGILARHPDQGRSPDGDAAAAQSGGRRGRRRNWDLGGAALKKQRQRARPTSRSPVSSSATSGSKAAWSTFDDRASKQNRRAEAIDLAINQAGADQPVKLDGGVTMEGKRATLAGSVARPQGVAAGEPSPIEVDLGVPAVRSASTER